MPHTREWNAVSYGRVAAPVEGFGHKLLDRLELRGDETVLDAGCGPGTLTRALAERVPAGTVIGVDASRRMVDAARSALGALAEILHRDLLDLELERAVDVVFSSATFHWIPDHDRLYERLFAALRPGGRLLAQCGGAGNIAAVGAALEAAMGDDRFAAHLAGWPGPWRFTSPEETSASLAGAGFRDVQAALHTEIVRPRRLPEYLSTMILGAHLDRLPPDLHEPFVTTVAAKLPRPPEIEYVRLTMSARRPGPPGRA